MRIYAHSLASYKQFILIFLGCLTAFGPLVTDMYLPALPAMTGWFGTSQSLVQLSLTTCMVGLAVGQLIFGPLSDKYGRKHVLQSTLLLFAVSTLLCIYAENIRLFVIMRLLQGTAAAGSIVISRSVSADMFEGRELAKVLAIVGAINGVAPVLAPVLGGTVTETLGWRGIFVILLFLGIVLLSACALYRESLPADRRSNASVLHVVSCFKPLFRNRLYVCYTLQMGFAQAVLFANIASAPFIMQEHYGFSPMQFSVCFGLNALAIVVFAALAAKFRKVENGTLWGSIGALVFSACECAALFSGCPFIVYEIFIVGILCSLGLCFTSSTTLAMDSERECSGSASAVFGAAGFAFGGIVSPLVGIGNPLHATGIVFLVSAICSAACVYAARKKA